MSCLSVMPLGQSVPRLIGWSGSPSTWTTVAPVTFLALSPRVWMITPQLTAQYGQVDRVSVVRAIFNSRVAAYAGPRSKPKAVNPAPVAVATRKSLRETVMDSPPFRIRTTKMDDQGIGISMRVFYNANDAPGTAAN